MQAEHKCAPESDGWEGSQFECPQCGEDWYLDVSIVDGEYKFFWCKWSEV